MNAIVHPRAAVEPAVPLVEELTPAPEPWDIVRKLARQRHLLFLDSASTDSPHSRFSFVAADPFTELRAAGFIPAGTSPAARLPFNAAADPLRLLAEHLGRFRTETLPGLPPFQGGAAGLFGYDLCHLLERLPRPRHDEFQLPDLAVGFYDWVIAFDHAQRRAWLISTGFPETEPARRKRQAALRLRTVRRWLAAPADDLPCLKTPLVPPAALCPQFAVPHWQELTSNFDRTRYLDTVRQAIEYVHAGDCFQVNIAQRLLHPATLPPLELYRRLRERNAAPFAGFFCPGPFAVASTSPERFLRVQQGEVVTQPIKGTRPRGATPNEDEASAVELLHSAKDRAENVMIVDLMRNDLGRVCRYGSVRVPALCRLESYRYVHHLVSEVRGRLRDGLGPVHLLRAAFPGGSVTGAPKVRAMEIIAELEPTARGPYCGALGYLGFDGSMDTNILIRTCTVAKGWVQFPVGGGIVADSVPEREYEETWHKAEGLLRALRP
jgi:para-aminobenzoate synthetase component 1